MSNFAQTLISAITAIDAWGPIGWFTVLVLAPLLIILTGALIYELSVGFYYGRKSPPHVPRS